MSPAHPAEPQAQQLPSVSLLGGLDVAVEEDGTQLLLPPGKPRSERVETERFKSFTYDELLARDKVNLDITWLRDESPEDMENLPAPEIIAREIVEDLTAALAEFEAVAAALEASALPDGGGRLAGVSWRGSGRWCRTSR